MQGEELGPRDSLAVELERKLQRGALEQRDVEVELRELQPGNRERSNMAYQAVLTHVLDQLIRLSVMQRRGNVLKSDVALRLLALNRDEDDVLLPVHDVCVRRAAVGLLLVLRQDGERDSRPNALLSGKCATAITMGSSDVPSTEAAAGKRGV